MRNLKYAKTMILLALTVLIGLTGCTHQTSSENRAANAPNVDNREIDNGVNTTESGKPHTEGTDGKSSASEQTSPPKTVKETGKTISEPGSVSAPMGKVTAVRAVDAQSGWIGGEGWIARTDNGGKSWVRQYSQSGVIVHQLFALNGQEVWATLEKASPASSEGGVNSGGYRLIHSKDGGKTWQEAGTVPNGGFLHFVSGNEAYSSNARTTDGGKNWTSLAVPKHLVGDAYFHDKSNGWAATQSKDAIQVQRTTDGGKTWRTVMTRKTVVSASGAVIRSAGKNDAWVEWIGDSGMTQTSYSLFHTVDGGETWQTVLANSTAGGGPAPGFPSDYTGGPVNAGSSPGPLYVVDPRIAFMGGQCMACDKPNTMGKTVDGGKTWTNGTQSFEGYGPQLIAMVDASHGWWICTDNEKPSVMYTTSDGGSHWNKTYTFGKPNAVS